MTSTPDIHAMVDLETMGTRPGDAIISIGAVRFTAAGILDRFHVGITLESNERLGLKFQASTMLWWLSEDRAEARRQWLDLPKVDIVEALCGFNEWLESPVDHPMVQTTQTEIKALWGNGATFDNMLLRAACDKSRIAYPVPFWADACYRTVKNMVPDIRLERIGTHHVPVDDAESQARHLIGIARHAGLPL